MSRNSVEDAKAGAAIVFLAIVILAVLTGIACVGLFILFYAKVKEEELVKGHSNPLYPIWISLAVTTAIAAGSASGAALAYFFNVDGAFLELVQQSGAVRPRRDWRGQLQIDAQLHYLKPLIIYHALPFWMELTAALYAIRLGIRAKLSGQSFPAKQQVLPSLKALAAAYMAVTFLFGNAATSSTKYPKLGCNPVGPVCQWASQQNLNEIAAFIAAKIAVSIDAWLVLEHTLRASLGNQFKLTELCPAIFVVWAIVRWVQAGAPLPSIPASSTTRTDLAGLVKRGPELQTHRLPGRVSLQPSERVSSVRIRHVAPMVYISLAMTAATVGSFFITLWMLQ